VVDVDNKGFYTFYKYMGKEFNNLSASEEDYIEMIYRITFENNKEARINDLATILHVKPPSVTKMIKRLDTMGFVKYKKYGTVTLEEKGNIMGSFLLKRHEIIEKFLKLVVYENGCDEEKILEETEKIEHTISNEALKGIDNVVEFFSTNADVKKIYDEFREKV